MAESDLARLFRSAERDIIDALPVPSVDEVRMRFRRRQHRGRMVGAASAVACTVVAVPVAVALSASAPPPDTRSVGADGSIVVSPLASVPALASDAPTAPHQVGTPHLRRRHAATPPSHPPVAASTCDSSGFATVRLHGHTVDIAAVAPGAGGQHSLCPGQELAVTVVQYAFATDGSQVAASSAHRTLSSAVLSASVPLTKLPKNTCAGDLVVFVGNHRIVSTIAAGAGNPYPPATDPSGGTLLFRSATPCA